MGHFRFDPAGRDCVDGDLARRKLQRERSHKANESGLGGAVCGIARYPELSENGGDYNDAASVRHVRNCGTSNVVGAQQVGIDDIRPRFGIRGREGSHSGYAGVVDDDVNPTESLYDLRDGGFHAGAAANIHGHSHGPFASKPAFVLLQFFDGAPAHPDTCALVVKSFRNGETYSTARPSYNGNLIYGHTGEGSINHRICKTYWSGNRSR